MASGTDALGSLIVRLGLDATEFTSGLTKSEYQAKRSMERIEKTSLAVATVLTRVATAAGVAGLAVGAMSVKFINAAADLDDLAEKTGASVETLSKLEQQARISGTPFEVVETSLIKLAKSLEGTDEESTKATRALTALGLKAEDLRKVSDNGERLKIVSDALNKFADGSGKSALAMDLLGRSGAQALPFLKDLANDQELAATVTAKQAAEAEELGKAWRRLLNDVRNIGQGLALDLIPFLKDTITALRDTRTGLEGMGPSSSLFIESLRAIVVLGANVIYVLNTIGIAAVGVKAQLEGFATGGIKGFQEAREMMKQILAEERAAFDERERRLMDAGSARPGTPDAAKPLLNYSAIDPSGAKKAADALRGLQDAQAKIALDAEQDRANKVIAIIQREHSEGIRADREFFKERLEIQQRAAAEELRVIDEQLSRQTSHRDKQKAGSKDYIDAQKAVEETLARRGKVERDVAHQAALGNYDALAALRAYGAMLDGINIKLLELQGNTAEAARKQFELQNRDLRRKLRTEADAGDPEAQQALNRLDLTERLTGAQAEFNRSREEAERITARLGIEEERIQNALRVGAITEFDALIRTGNARKDVLRLLEAEVIAREAIARASENPALILQAEQARAALEKLRSETDLVGQKFNSIFQDAFTDGLQTFREELQKSGKFIDSLGKAFSRFATRVINEIEAIQAKNLANALFGGSSSSSSGVIGLLAKLFGLAGNGGDTIDTSGIVIDPVDTGSLVGGAAGYASGTDFVPKTGYALVHRGEEIVRPGQRGNVIYINPSIHIDSRTDAAAVRGEVQRGVRQAVAMIPGEVRRGGAYRKSVRG